MHTYFLYRYAYDQLLAARGSKPFKTCPLTSKKKEDCPQIKFYMQRLYSHYLKTNKKKKGVLNPADGNKDCGSARLANDNQNVSMQYVEDEASAIVDGDTAKNIRNHAWAVLIEIEGNPNMRLPKKWRRVGVMERKFFQEEMYARFPYLKICHDHWKCHYLAGRALSSYKEAKKRRKNTKVADDSSSDDSDDSSKDSSSEESDEDSANPAPPAPTGSSKRKSAPTGTQRRSNMPPAPSKRARTVVPIPADLPAQSPALEMLISPSSSLPPAPISPISAQLPEPEQTHTTLPLPSSSPSPRRVIPKAACTQPDHKNMDAQGMGKAALDNS